MSNRFLINLKLVLSIISLLLLGFASIIFSILYIENTELAFIINNKKIIKITVTAIIIIFSTVAFVFQFLDNNFIFRITIVVFLCIVFFSACLYFIKIFNLEESFSNVENLRNLVLSYGKYTVPAFIIIQFLQVVILPIPSIITIGAGVALFGSGYSFLFSYVGILSASYLAFFIGRKFGVKAVNWLIGKDNLEKGINLINGRDNLLLTLMFIFPFFPDDLLCFVAGISSMSSTYFIIMITLTRAFSTAISVFTLNGTLLPINTWWGFSFWLIFFAVAVIICVVVYKRKGNDNGKNYSSYRS